MATLSPDIFEEKLEIFFERIPPLPGGSVGRLVPLIPIIAIILGAFATFNSGILELIQQERLPTLLNNKIFDASYYLLIVLHLIIGSILFLSYKSLQLRELRGWRMLFYTNLIYVIVSLVMGDLGGLVVNAVVFYLLFQIKSYYN